MADAPSPIEPLIAVRLNATCPDKAVVFDAAAIMYAQTRNLASLTIADGETPDKFVLRPLTKQQVRRLKDEPGHATRACMAFRMACHEIRCADGTTLRAEDHGQIVGGQMADEKWIDAVWDRFSDATIYEMGDIAIARASAALGKAPAYNWPGG